MHEEPKSFWNKPRRISGGWRTWLVLVGILFSGELVLVHYLPGGPKTGFDWTMALLFLLVISLFLATGLLTAFWLLRWLCNGHRFKRTLLVFAWAVTGVALFYAVENWRGWHAWHQFVKTWEAKGEKFNFQAYVPPPVPDDQNFALTPVVASCYETYYDKSGQEMNPRRTNVVDRLSMLSWRDNHWAKAPWSDGWTVGKALDLAAWQAYFRSPPPTNSTQTNAFPVAARPQTAAADILLALGKYDSTIEELRQASRRPASRFPLMYDNENPAAILLPHLAALKYCSQALQLRAVAELQNHQRDQAHADVKLAWRLMDSVRTEPIIITHLVRLAMLRLTLQPVYEGLAEHRWSGEQLGTLDADLAGLDFLADYAFCQRSHLAFLAADFAYLQRTRDPQYLFYFDYNSHQKTPAEEFLVFLFRHCPRGWLYQNQLRYCQFTLQHLLPTVEVSRQLAFPGLVQRANHDVQKEVSPPGPYNFIEEKLLFPIFSGMKSTDQLEKFACAQTSVNLARVAIALERYYLEHAEYPVSLASLSPAYLARLPHDVIGGQLLKYQRTGAGQFLLYSIGWNEKDDGGVMVFTNDEPKKPIADSGSGDWVWRYPAK